MNTQNFAALEVERIEQILSDYETKHSSTVRSQLIKQGIMTKGDTLKSIIQELRDELERRKTEQIEEINENETMESEEQTNTNNDDHLLQLMEEIKEEQNEEEEVKDAETIKIEKEILREEAREQYELDKFCPYKLANIFFKERNTYKPNPSDKVVKLWMSDVFGGSFFSLEDFNAKFKSFMLNAIDEHNPEKVKEFKTLHPHALNRPFNNEAVGLSTKTSLRGIRYLDIDHLNVSDMEDLRTKMQKVIKLFEGLENYYILSFLPENIEERIAKKDAGLHTYIIYDENEENEEQISEISKALMLELGESFDLNPWKSSGLNLPFCHKSVKSSHYLLDLGLCVPSTIEEIKQKMNTIEFVSDAPTFGNIQEKQKKVFKRTKMQKLLDGELEAIAEGFKGIEIHTTQMGKIKGGRRLGLLPICSAIKSVGTYEECERLEQLIYRNAKLSSKARESWNNYMFNVRPSYNGKKQLWEIIKIYNPSYYETAFKQFEEKTFIDSPFNWEMFVETREFGTPQDVADALKQCVAVCSSGGGFIVKYEKEYQRKKLSEMLADIDRVFEFEITDQEEQEEMERRHKSKKIKRIKLREFLTVQRYVAQLAIYRDLKPYSEDPKVLSAWIPPAIVDFNAVLIRRFVDYFMGRMRFTAPLIEFFDSISYKLKHPDRLLVKTFIFHGFGDDGKTFLKAAVCSLFGKFARTVTKQQITEDQYNDWQDDCFVIWVEEPKSTNKRGQDDTKELVETLKQLTTIETSRRGMYKSLREGRNQALIGLSTNTPNLAGLSSSSEVDNAMIERMVIVDFLKATKESKAEVQAISELSHLKQKDYCLEESKAFIYGLYQWFMNRKISDSFKTDRYEGEDKKVILSLSRATRQTYTEDWLLDVSPQLFHKKTLKGNKAVVYASKTKLTESMKKRLEDNPTKQDVKWMDEMQDIGFIFDAKKYSGHSERVAFIDADKWEEWVKYRTHKTTDEDEDEEDEMSYYINDDPDAEALN